MSIKPKVIGPVTVTLTVDMAEARARIGEQAAAWRHIRGVIALNRRLIRAEALTFRALEHDCRRRQKRADRLINSVFAEWERRTGRPITNRMRALFDIEKESRQALNAANMIAAGMTLNFKPKVTVR